MMSKYKTCDDVLGKCTCASHPYSDCANCSCGYRVDELLAERDALKAELEKLKFEAENMATTIQGAIEEHNALRAKLDKATAALRNIATEPTYSEYQSYLKQLAKLALEELA